MLSCTTLFSTSTLPHPVPIRLSGKIVISTHGGPVQAHTGKFIVYALYVPTFRDCLLSVSCLDLSGLRAAFANRACTIYQIQNSSPILTGHLENGIYSTRSTSNPMYSPQLKLLLTQPQQAYGIASQTWTHQLQLH